MDQHYEQQPILPESPQEPVHSCSGAVHGDDLQPRYAPNASKPPKKKKKILGIIALVLCCGLFGCIAGAGGALAIDRYLEQNETEEENVTHVLQGLRENAVIDIVQVDTGKQMTPAQVYAANVNSTVGITTSITTNYWGFQSTSAASGSGFIITADGYILTNYHVIEGSDSITVSLYDGTAYDAALIGYDESNDIAILKVDAEGLSPVVIGDSDNLNVGDSVVAIGNPLGELTFSLTAGAVSAKDRKVTMSNSVTMDLIQTDCAINSGNSGGALFNLYGEVIGITNAKYSSSSSSEASIDNIGFAIPINHVWSIIESIIEKGYISKPYVGITVTDVSAESQSFGIPQGAAIYQVAEESPADKSGLQSGDVITKADDLTITCGNDFVDCIGQAAAGDEIRLTVYRKGEVLEITVVIEEKIQSALENEEAEQQQQGQQPNFPWGSRP